MTPTALHKDDCASAKQAAKYLGVSLGRVYHYLTGYASPNRQFLYLLQGWKVKNQWVIPWRSIKGFCKPRERAGRPRSKG